MSKSKQAIGSDDAERRMSPAERRGSAMSEESSWAEMPFRVGSAGMEAWCSPAISDGGDHTRNWVAECILGTAYGCEIAEHMRDYVEPGSAANGDRLAEVAEAIFKSGKFRAIEKSFFRAVRAQIATGRAVLTSGVDAVLCEYGEPVPDPRPAT